MQKNKNIVKAINRNVRSSPRKINILLKNIRGKKADTVIRDLSFARQRIASEIKKTVQSAIANAENNNGVDIDDLKITAIQVNQGPTMKRLRPRARGRADRLLKRTSHLTVEVSERGEK